MRATSPNPLKTPKSPSAAKLESASVPVLGNSFWTSTFLGVDGWEAGWFGVDGSTCLGMTVTGTSTSTISPDGSFTFTLTLGFCPAVSVAGISPTSTISAPFGNSICFLTSSLPIGVPTSTTIGVVLTVSLGAGVAFWVTIKCN